MVAPAQCAGQAQERKKKLLPLGSFSQDLRPELHNKIAIFPTDLLPKMIKRSNVNQQSPQYSDSV